MCRFYLKQHGVSNNNRVHSISILNNSNDFLIFSTLSELCCTFDFSTNEGEQTLS